MFGSTETRPDTRQHLTSAQAPIGRFPQWSQPAGTAAPSEQPRRTTSVGDGGSLDVEPIEQGEEYILLVSEASPEAPAVGVVDFVAKLLGPEGQQLTEHGTLVLGEVKVDHGSLLSREPTLF